MDKIDKPIHLKMRESAGYNFVGTNFTNMGVIGSGSYG